MCDAKLDAFDEQLEAPESVATADESRWRAGVNRQARSMPSCGCVRCVRRRARNGGDGPLSRMGRASDGPPSRMGASRDTVDMQPEGMPLGGEGPEEGRQQPWADSRCSSVRARVLPFGE